MKKFLKSLKKYFIISFTCAFILVVDIVVRSSSKYSLIIYIERVAFMILPYTIMLMPLIVLLDLLFVQVLKSLFDDYIEGDRREKILIIVVLIIMLFREIYIWS